MFKERPNGYLAFFLSLLTAISYSLAESRPVTIFWTMTLVCFIFAILTIGWIVVDVWLDLFERYNETAKVTPKALELERAAKLTDAQAAAVPAITYNALVGLVYTTKEEAWSYMVITKDGNIPYEFAQDFLSKCGLIKLKSIRSYSNGSMSQKYATWLTTWLRDRGWAIGGESETGKTAEWLSEQAYWDVCKLFGVEPDDLSKLPNSNVAGVLNDN